MNDKPKHDLEHQLSELLLDGDMEARNEKEEGRRLIPPKYEIRIQTTQDPIVEETRKYRSMAKELDDRYDKYMDRAGEGNGEDGSENSRS